MKVMNTIPFAVSVLALPYPYGITFGAVKKKRAAPLARDLCHFRLRDIFPLKFYFHLLSPLFIITSITRQDISKEKDIKLDKHAQRTFAE